MNDGIDYPYLEDELKVRYSVEFVRTPVNERLVICNAVYLGETEIRNNKGGYNALNHVWLVDFLRANNIDFSIPVEGLLTTSCKRWRNAGLGDPRTALAGLCAVTADRRRNIVAVMSDMEARL